MNRILMSIIAVCLIFALGAFSGWTFRGKASDRGVIKQQQKDAEAVIKHEEKKDEVVKIKEVIKWKIKEIPDPSGCLDAPSPDNYLDELLTSDRQAKSGFD